MKTTKFGNLSKTYKNEGKVEGEILDKIKAHLSTTTGNPHKVTVEDIGAYSAKKIENKSVVDFAVAVETFGKTTDEDNESIPKFKMTESEGLAFEDNDDGKTCSVSGIGTCSDTEVVIPMFSPSGKLVSTLKASAFEGNENITALFIPKSVYKISSYSINCPNLKILALSNPDVQTSSSKITAQLDKVYYSGSYDAFIHSSLSETIMSENTKLFCGFFDVDLLLSKADSDDVYTKDDIDTLLSKKRDNDDFTPIASADKAQETISLVGITTVETSDDENGWEITSNTLSATYNPLFSNGAIFHIDFQGNVNLEIDANAFEGVGLNPAEAGYVEIDGIKLTAENGSTSGCKYRYNGDITREIIIQAKYARYEFATFIKNIKIYSDGFMSGEQAERLDNLDTKIGNIDAALDELHNYATSLIGGEA